MNKVIHPINAAASLDLRTQSVYLTFVGVFIRNRLYLNSIMGSEKLFCSLAWAGDSDYWIGFEFNE